MPQRTHLTKAHKAAIREAALKRHEARKAAGLPAPSGKSYITPPDPKPPEVQPVAPDVAKPTAPPQPVVPRVILRDDGTPSPPKPTPVVAPPPPVVVDPGPRNAFTAWLRSNAGRLASDTRMSQDPVRFGAELDDRLWIAWQAGFAEGREG